MAFWFIIKRIEDKRGDEIASCKEFTKASKWEKAAEYFERLKREEEAQDFRGPDVQVTPSRYRWSSIHGPFRTMEEAEDAEELDTIERTDE